MFGIRANVADFYRAWPPSVTFQQKRVVAVDPEAKTTDERRRASPPTSSSSHSARTSMSPRRQSHRQRLSSTRLPVPSAPVSDPPIRPRARGHRGCAAVHMGAGAERGRTRCAPLLHQRRQAEGHARSRSSHRGRRRCRLHPTRPRAADRIRESAASRCGRDEDDGGHRRPGAIRLDDGGKLGADLLLAVPRASRLTSWRAWRSATTAGARRPSTLMTRLPPRRAIGDTRSGAACGAFADLVTRR